MVGTLGHGTRTLAEFLAPLTAHAVAGVAEVRRFPRSRRHPHFARESLARALATAGVRCQHFPGLGGTRRPGGGAVNAAGRTAGFRGCAGDMQTAEFAARLAALLALARGERTAMLSAEAVPWRCHRSLIADALNARGAAVGHILAEGRAQPHRLTRFARVEGGRVTVAGGARSHRGGR